MKSCLRLRVQDLDFSQRTLRIREGKGGKDRVTVLPDGLIEPLEQHLLKVSRLHRLDLKAGFGEVYLPAAPGRKYPQAAKQWQYGAMRRALVVCNGAGANGGRAR